MCCIIGNERCPRQWRLSRSGRIHTLDISSQRGWGTTSSCTKFVPVVCNYVQVFSTTSDDSRLVTASDDYSFCIDSTHNGNILLDSGQNDSTRALVHTPLVWLSGGQQPFVVSIGKITCFNLSMSLSSEWSICENKPRVSVASNSRFMHVVQVHWFCYGFIHP